MSRGTLVVDLKGVTSVGGGLSSDKITVSDFAIVAGTVTPNIAGGAIARGDRFNILSAGGGLTIVDNSVGFDFGIEFGNEGAFVTIEDVVPLNNLLGAGVATPSQRDLLGYIGLFSTRLTVDFNVGLQTLLTAMRGLPDAEAFAKALTEIAPNNATGRDALQAIINAVMANAALSCGVADGPQAVIREGQCKWAKVTGQYFHHGATSGTAGFTQRSGGIAGGVQYALPANWRLGVAMGYEKSQGRVGGGLSSRSADSGQAAVIVKNRIGNTSLAAVFSGGYSWSDAKRSITIPGLVATATSNPESHFAGVKLRAGHLIEMGALGPLSSWYLRPVIDLDGFAINNHSYTETGGGPVNLQVFQNSDVSFSASPGLQIGGETTISDDTIVRPWLRVGATFSNDAKSTVSATFSGAPGGVTPFRFSSELDRNFVDASAGVNVLWDNGLEMRLNYEGRFSANSEQHTGGVKLTWKF